MSDTNTNNTTSTKRRNSIPTSFSLDSLPTPPTQVYVPSTGFSLHRPDYTPEQSQAIVNVWKNCSIASLVSQQKPLSIDPTTTTVIALTKLARYAVMSAPVIHPVTKRFVGMLDYRDFCALVCRVYAHMSEKSTKEQSEDGAEKRQKVGENVKGAMKRTISSITDILRYAPAGEITNFSRRDSFYSVPLSGSLLDAVELFSQGIHRAIVLDEHGTFCGVVSQSDAVRELNKHITDPELHFIFSKSLESLGVTKNVHTNEQCSDAKAKKICSHSSLKRLLTVKENTPVIEALELMQSHGVSSVALVDSDDGVVACFSMNDFKYILSESSVKLSDKDIPDVTSPIDESILEPSLPLLHLLEGTCGELMSQVTLSRDRESGFATKLPVFHCSPATALNKAVAIICATKTHRIWIANTENSVIRPVAVVSLSDILHIFVPKDISKYNKLSEQGYKPVQFVAATSTDGPPMN